MISRVMEPARLLWMAGGYKWPSEHRWPPVAFSWMLVSLSCILLSNGVSEVKKSVLLELFTLSLPLPVPATRSNVFLFRWPPFWFAVFSIRKWPLISANLPDCPVESEIDPYRVRLNCEKFDSFTFETLSTCRVSVIQKTLKNQLWRPPRVFVWTCVPRWAPSKRANLERQRFV